MKARSEWNSPSAAAASLARDVTSTVGVHELDPLCDPRWVTLVNRHPQASVFHSTNWLRALRTEYGYQPVAITTCPPGTSLTNGLVLCRIKSWLTGRRLVSLPFSDHCEPMVDSAADFDNLFLRMRQYVDEGKYKYFEIRPVKFEPNGQEGLSRFVTYRFHLLDLGPSSEKLFRNFHKDCVQRKIRRAEREKLKYEEGTSEDLLHKFYRLQVMTRRRQYLPPQPLSWFRNLITAFGPNLKIRVASKDNVPIASIVTLSHKKSMIYKYGCSNATFNKFGGMAFLFWRTIQEAKSIGLVDFEMGRSDVDNLGLIAFKEHWGATGKLISYWTYPCRGRGLPSVCKGKLTQHMISTVPDLALKAVGKFLYRHVG
jgi:hypothetical protein